MLTTGPLYFLAFIGLGLSAFLMGRLLRKFISLETGNVVANEGIWIFLGHLICIALIAVVVSQGKSIFILFIFGAMGLWAMGKGQDQKQSQDNSTLPDRCNLFILLGSAVFSFVLFHFYYVNLADFSLLVPAPDYINYGNMADYLVRYGVESNLFQFDKTNPGVFPYHYLELWTTGVLSFLFDLPEAYVLVLVVYPFHLLFLLLGIFGLVEHFSKSDRRWWHFLLPFLLIPSSGLFFGSLNGILPLYEGSEIFAYNPLNYHKLIIIQAALLFASFLFLIGEKKWSIMLLIVIAILFISALPSVILFLGVLLLIKILRPRNIPNLTLGYLFASLGFLILVPIFYFLFGEKGLGGNVLDPDRLFNISTRINVIAGTLIRYAYLFFWIIPLLLIVWKRSRGSGLRDLTGFSLMLFFGALFCWATLFFANNSVQLFSNIGTPLIGVLIIISSLYFVFQIEDFQKPMNMVVLVIIALSIAVTWAHWFDKPAKGICDSEYFETLAFQSHELNPIGAFIRDASDYSSPPSRYHTFSVQGREMGLLDGKYFPISLSVHATPISSPLQRHLIENSVFFRFSGDDVAGSQYEFIKEYNVDYLFLSKKADMPASLDSIFTLKSTNDCTGERFYLRDQVAKKD